MRWGIIKLYCPICQVFIRYNGNIAGGVYHHKEFGIVCSKECWDKAELKYARMILGKDDE